MPIHVSFGSIQATIFFVENSSSSGVPSVESVLHLSGFDNWPQGGNGLDPFDPRSLCDAIQAYSDYQRTGLTQVLLPLSPFHCSSTNESNMRMSFGPSNTPNGTSRHGYSWVLQNRMSSSQRRLCPVGFGSPAGDPGSVSTSNGHDAIRKIIEKQVRHLLSKFVDAMPPERRRIRNDIAENYSPLAIAQAAFEEYDQSGKEAILLIASALLEEFGETAWRALEWIASSQRGECELFVGDICRFAGVSEQVKTETLKSLGSNPSSVVRRGLLQHLVDLRPYEAKQILQQLSCDTDPDIQAEAAERLEMAD